MYMIVGHGHNSISGAGLPPRYRDSVRQITPDLPLFLYNYSTHQLHGVFEPARFGGTNIDPNLTAWEGKKIQGESRFPAQVRIITRNLYEPLEEDSFRPILHHYDGPKFRLELNIPERLKRAKINNIECTCLEKLETEMVKLSTTEHQAQGFLRRRQHHMQPLYWWYRQQTFSNTVADFSMLLIYCNMCELALCLYTNGCIFQY